MILVREICTLGNAERQKLNIPVRQPLQTIFIHDSAFETLKSNKPVLDLIKEELNIKDIVFDQSKDKEAKKISLNSSITPELKAEGGYRELLRTIQDMRKKQGLTPNDLISLSLETSPEGKEIIQKFELEIKKTALISEISLEKNSAEEIKIGDL